MARMGTIFKTKKLGAGWANKEILKIVNNIEPDLVLIGHSDLMSPNVLKEIKTQYPKTKIAFWYVDPLYLEQKLDFIYAFAPYLDAIFCTTGGEYLRKLKQPHLKVAYMPNVGHRNVEVLKQFESVATDKTFIFCGVIYKEPVREKFLQDLAETLKQHQVQYQYYGCFGQPGVYGKGYYNVLSESLMGLNYSRKNDITLYSSDRIVQLTGNGLLTFSPRIPDFEKLYTDQEVVYFDDQQDLASKIKYYADHPDQAQRIAQAGWNKTRHSFNAKRISQFMLELTFDQPFTEAYEWLHEVYA